jgi:hypothetical protein
MGGGFVFLGLGLYFRPDTKYVEVFKIIQMGFWMSASRLLDCHYQSKANENPSFCPGQEFSVASTSLLFLIELTVHFVAYKLGQEKKPNAA